MVNMWSPLRVVEELHARNESVNGQDMCCEAMACSFGRTQEDASAWSFQESFCICFAFF